MDTMAFIAPAPVKLQDWAFDQALDRPKSNSSDGQASMSDMDKITVKPDCTTSPEDSADCLELGYLSSEEDLSSMGSDDDMDDSLFLDEEPQIMEAQYLQTVAVTKGDLAVSVTVINLGKAKAVSLTPAASPFKSQSLPTSPSLRPVPTSRTITSSKPPQLRQPSKLSTVVSSQRSPETPKDVTSPITALPPVRSSLTPSSDRQQSSTPPVSRAARRFRNLSRTFSVVRGFTAETPKKSSDCSSQSQGSPISFSLEPRGLDTVGSRNSVIDTSRTPSDIFTTHFSAGDKSISRKWAKRKAVMSMAL